jgi:ribulose kinase
MNRAVPLTVVAGALACFVAMGSAQAATVNTGILGKLNATAQSSSQVEKAGWRHRRYRRRHYRRCVRRCMWRTHGAYRHCRRRCHHRRWWR